MSPGSLQNGRGQLIDLTIEKIHKSGVGYWLTNHKRKMNEKELNNYLFLLSDRYENLNINELLTRYGVKYIYSVNPISEQIPINKILQIGNGYLYQINT